MTELTKVTFPDELRMTRIYTNEEELRKMGVLESGTGTLPQVQDKYGTLRFPAPLEDRPYVYGVLVLSADGRMAFEDLPVGPYIARKNDPDPDGGLLDYWTLIMLRAHADGIITAARTLSAEPEASLHISDERLIGQRKRYLKKNTRHPLQIVLSRRGTQIPYDHVLFGHLDDEDMEYLVVTAAAGVQQIRAECPRTVCEVTLRQDSDLEDIGHLREILDRRDPGLMPVLTVGTRPGELDTGLMMKALRRLGIGTLGIESPTVAYHLMERQMLDEYFLNYSMLFAGGAIAPGTGQPFRHDDHPHSRLLSVSMHGPHFLYTRHRLIY